MARVVFPRQYVQEPLAIECAESFSKRGIVEQLADLRRQVLVAVRLGVERTLARTVPMLAQVEAQLASPSNRGFGSIGPPDVEEVAARVRIIEALLLDAGPR